MHKTVLVTGCAGYIGSTLVGELLQKGYKVIGVDTLTFGGEHLIQYCTNSNFEFYNTDARDKNEMSKLISRSDVIIPLAAIVGAPACAKYPLDATTINLGAIETIIELKSKEQLLIYPTTNSGYGTSDGLSYCDENTPLKPISLYGETKVQAEEAVLNAENSITFRLATVFGVSPRMRLDLLVNNFTHLAATQRYLVIFEKDFKRNFVHIRDVCKAFIFAIENSASMIGKPYNLGLDSANMSKQDLAEMVARYVPNLFIHYSEIGTDPDKRNYIVSNERLRQAGFEAEVSVETGIEELLRAFKLLKKSNYFNI